ncbi:MAG: FliA/WhiG family RNA polymerase sigma factor [Gemmatimonadota bacterium]
MLSKLIAESGPMLELWRSYRRTHDFASRTELLERHLYLVRLLARKLSMRIGRVVEIDDLVGAGTLGLVQALESFDLGRGNAFATYASRRISGAMLDELRNRDWVPRSVRSKARKLYQASSRLESELGRSAEPQELARVLDIDEPTYQAWRESVDGAVMVSLDDPAEATHLGAGLGARLSSSDAVDALENLGEQEGVATLAAALAALPERERMVLVLYFYEELNLREIAKVMHLTESRISQIRTAALKKMRRGLIPAAA